MILSLKILFLLWLINFTPPLLAHILEDRWDIPVDLNRRFQGGHPLFGHHKTIRGVVGGMITGVLIGLAFGFPVWVGFLAGALSMSGDLASSFIKRRLSMPSGSVAPGLDQVFEGLFPFLVLAPYSGLGLGRVSLLVLVFSMGAFIGSIFFKQILLVKPFEDYPRPIRPRTRLRELRSCQITSNPLHHILNFEDSFYYHILMKGAFRLLGIYEKGKQNALDVVRCQLTFTFPDLPRNFDGYRILFLSDLHLDGLEGLTERLVEMLRDTNADLCMLGGDLRMETHGPFQYALAHLHRLVPSMRARDGILAVLGNHDCTEIIAPLEAMGVELLINEAKAIDRNGERIWVVGVDDPHYYRCHDLDEAFRAVPPGAFSIFVAHSNEIYKETARYSPRLYLCGHSHAGQIQIHPIGPIFTHSRAPRRYCCGTWEYEKMQGFTSCGVGVSGVPVRFSSRGEVVEITLKRDSSR